mgnify:CR=1 FL=1
MSHRSLKLNSFLSLTAAVLLSVVASTQAAAVSITVGFADNPNSFQTLDSSSASLGCGAPGSAGELTCSGTGFNEGGGWVLDSWNLFADPDPTISNTASVTNNTASTQSFLISVSLPTSISFGPPSLIRGSIVLGGSDNNNDGVTVSSTGTNSIYNALIDGSTVRTLLDAPQTFTTPFPSGSVSSGVVDFGIPVEESIAVATLTSIGLDIRFDLSAGDSASFTSVFDVQPIPEPGTALLLGLGLVGLAARGRGR